MARLRDLLRRSTPRKLTPIATQPGLRRRSLLLAAAASASLAGCAPPAGPRERSSTPELASDLSNALRTANAARFAGIFTPDAEGRRLSGLLWRNLIALGVIDLTAQGDALVVEWCGPGEILGAVEQVVPWLVDGRIVRLAPRGPARPLWLAEPITMLPGDQVGVIVGGSSAGSDARGLLTAAERAVHLLATSELRAAVTSWDGSLVVGVPSTLDALAAVTGLGADVAARTQAVTVMASADSAPRIVLNRLAIAGLSTDELTTVLVHEGVHVVLRTPTLRAPLWLSEGLAESVAAASDRATKLRNDGLVRSSPRPTALPTAAELNGPDAARAYALSAHAVDAATARWGRPAVLYWLLDWTAPERPTEAELTATYLASLP